nr:hypothetical protein [Thiocapsa sp. KS1]
MTAPSVASAAAMSVGPQTGALHADVGASDVPTGEPKKRRRRRRSKKPDAEGTYTSNPAPAPEPVG